jgi:hypothetical protein
LAYAQARELVSRMAGWPRFRRCPTVGIALARFEQGQLFEGEGIGEAVLEYRINWADWLPDVRRDGKLPVMGGPRRTPLLNESVAQDHRGAPRATFRPDHASDLAHNGIGVRLVNPCHRLNHLEP